MSSTGPATVTNLMNAPPVFVNTADGFPDTTSYQNFIRNPQDAVPGQRDPGRFRLFQLHQQRRRRDVDPVRPGRDRLPRRHHDGRPAHRAAAADLRQRSGGLEHPGQQRDLRDAGRGLAVGGTARVAHRQLAGMDRNGNLQITQFYYGAAQPSTAAAEIAGALFYGSAQDNGGPVSDPNIISNGNITWSGPGGDATGVGTDQQGSGTAYQYFWPCCGGNDTDFFQYIGPGLSGAGLGAAGQAGGGYVGRTFGLLQASGGLPTPDPQWPFTGGANFAVNPVNGADVVISSSVGRIFATKNNGVTWFDIGDPAVFGSPGQLQPRPGLRRTRPERSRRASATSATSSTSAPRPGRSTSPRTAAAAARSNNWINISAGLDGSAVESIITDPTRGSHDAYAVTTSGVFYMANSIPVNFTGTLTSGAASVTGVSSTTGLSVGETVTGTGIPAGTTILNINSFAGTITLSANATAGGLESLSGTLAWVNITSNLHTLAYSIFGQNYDPTTDTANSVTLNQAITLSAIVADWRYQIPNNPSNPSAGLSPGAVRRRG